MFAKYFNKKIAELEKIVAKLEYQNECLDMYAKYFNKKIAELLSEVAKLKYQNECLSDDLADNGRRYLANLKAKDILHKEETSKANADYHVLRNENDMLEQAVANNASNYAHRVRQLEAQVEKLKKGEG
ncbi:MAG: hypothetical protein QNK11_07075 [Legionella sp.]|nr:hypothetical protein [Legionella sp.]